MGTIVKETIYDAKTGESVVIERELTEAEINAIKQADTAAKVEEANRHLTEAEVTLMFITQQINTLSVDDNTSLRMISYYPEWEVNNSYSIGYKVQRNGKLYKAIQAHTSLVGWEPELAPSLWAQINETHAGTLDDAIPYSGNMALEKDKYYYDADYVMYLCTRDSINPVYNPLSELVGLYVEVV